MVAAVRLRSRKCKEIENLLSNHWRLQYVSCLHLSSMTSNMLPGIRNPSFFSIFTHSFSIVDMPGLKMHLFNFLQVPLSLWLVLPAAISASVIARDDGPNSTSTQDLDRKRAAEIRDAFQFAMDGYFEYAFPDDELRPVNSTGDSNRVYGCGWGLSVVDALDTAIIMELDEIIDRSLDFIDTIDFTRTPTDNACRLFEVNVGTHPPYLSTSVGLA